MAAFIGVQRRFAGFPARVPNSIPILDIEITSYTIHRHAVIAITGYTAELGILIKIIAASGVTDQTEEILVSQIIDPRERCLRSRDYILTMLVIKISVIRISHLSWLVVFEIPVQNYCFFCKQTNSKPTDTLRFLSKCQIQFAKFIFLL